MQLIDYAKKVSIRRKILKTAVYRAVSISYYMYMGSSATQVIGTVVYIEPNSLY